MKCPKKLYILVSRKCRDDWRGNEDETFTSRADAREACARANHDNFGDADDWRVETFVKGD